MSDSTTLVVLFERLGPYHIARLEAAGRLGKLVCIEVYAVDKTYAWEVIDGAVHFQRVRLIDTASSRFATATEIIKRVDTALDQIDPHVVAVPGWATPAALAALDWCARHQRRAVIMSESTAEDNLRRRVKENIKRRIVGGFGSSALVGGMPHAEYIIALGIVPERVFTGYDVIDNAYFMVEAESARKHPVELRAQLHLPEHYFLASSRFIEKKNLFGLLKAYKRYLATTIGEYPWSLVLLGDGPLREELVTCIREFDLASYVIMPGFKQYAELPAYYALADGFVHASTSEQWGLVVNEAMACGIPVLVSNRCGCARDLVIEGRTGWTFNPHDTSQLTAAMLKLSLLPDVQRAIMGHACEKHISMWSPEMFATNLWNAVAASSLPNRTPPFLDRWLLKLLKTFGKM